VTLPFSIAMTNNGTRKVSKKGKKYPTTPNVSHTRRMAPSVLYEPRHLRNINDHYFGWSGERTEAEKKQPVDC
jgi:hypothetical protein